MAENVNANIVSAELVAVNLVAKALAAALIAALGKHFDDEIDDILIQNACRQSCLCNGANPGINLDIKSLEDSGWIILDLDSHEPNPVNPTTRQLINSSLYSENPSQELRRKMLEKMEANVEEYHHIFGQPRESITSCVSSRVSSWVSSCVSSLRSRLHGMPRFQRFGCFK